MSDKITRRLHVLHSEWVVLREKMEYDESRLRLNLDLLMEVVASFFRQLGEFKDDNKIELADRHKSAGFMMSWIVRLKPVQIIVSSEDDLASQPEEFELLANEMFAIQAAFSCLNATCDLVGDFDFFDSLIKRLRERECPPEYLSSMLYLYERLRQSTTA